MSIYATLRMARVDGHELFVQGVPAHIDYTEPEWEFLGPPVPEGPSYARQAFRTIFVVTAEVPKTGQRYDSWLLQLSDSEYFDTPWPAMRKRIRAALRSTSSAGGLNARHHH